MKVCVTSTGHDLESQLDQRFGRAMCFIILDTDTMNIEAFDNQAASSGGGAGITSAQTMVDKKVEAIITGNVGPKAMNVLKKAGIDVYQGVPDTIKKNVDQFKEGLFKKIENTVAPHYGMGGQK